MTEERSVPGRTEVRPLVIGIGNDFRSDDRVGLVVARTLRERGQDRLTVIEHTGEAAGLLEAWEGARTVILVDAVVTGAEAGTVHRFDARARTIPRECFQCSTHAFGIPEAVELGRAMGRLPRRLLLFGIEGGNFAPGRDLSEAVARAAPVAVAWIRREIAARRRGHPDDGGGACTRRR
jgi:hydrogenase maturation protease